MRDKQTERIVLVGAFLRTKCVKPRFDVVIYDPITDICTVRQELTRTMSRYDILYDEIIDHDLLIEKTASYLNAKYGWDGAKPYKDDTGTPILTGFEPPPEDSSCFSARNRRKAARLEANSQSHASSSSKQKQQYQPKGKKRSSVTSASSQKKSRRKTTSRHSPNVLTCCIFRKCITRV